MPTLGSLTFGPLRTVLELNLKTATEPGFISQCQYQLIMVLERASGKNIPLYIATRPIF